MCQPAPFSALQELLRELSIGCEPSKIANGTTLELSVLTYREQLI